MTGLRRRINPPPAPRNSRRLHVARGGRVGNGAAKCGENTTGRKGFSVNTAEDAKRAIDELMETVGPERGAWRLAHAIRAAVDARASGRPLRVAELGDAELIILEKLGLL